MRRSFSLSTSKGGSGGVSVLLEVRVGDDRSVFHMCYCRNRAEARLAIAFIKAELVSVFQGGDDVGVASLLRYLDLVGVMSEEGRAA